MSRVRSKVGIRKSQKLIAIAREENSLAFGTY